MDHVRRSGLWKTIGLAATGLAGLALAVFLVVEISPKGDAGSGAACPGGRALVATGDAHFPPFSWLEDGKPSGFDVDFIAEVGRAMGCRVEVRLGEWTPSMAAVADGRADFVLGATDLDERRRTYAFTDRLLTLQSQLFARQDEFHVQSPGELPAGTVVGVERGDVVAADLRARFPRLTLREYPDQGAMLEGLAAGEVEAAAGDYYAGRWHLHRLGLTGKVKPVGQPFLNGAYALAVRKGNDALLSALNRALGQVKTDGTARALEDRWFGERFWRRGLSSETVAAVLGGLGIVLLALAGWNLALRTGVRRATRELRQSERRLSVTVESVRESEERFRALVNQSPDAIVAEVGGLVAYANSAAAELLGVPSPGRLVGAVLLDRVHRDDRAAAAARLRDASVDPRTPCEVRVVRPEGAVIQVELTAARITLGGQEAGLAVLRDVTRRKELEGQLRQALKMEAVGRLAGGVAHDFNNLLTVIQSACEFLGPAVSGEQAADLDSIREAAARAAALTRQLLAFSRRSFAHPQVLDVNEVVSETARLLSRLLGEDIALEVQCAPRPVAARVDRDQLAQVVMNLALNARDAMPAGGRLRIETRRVEVPEGRSWDEVPIHAGPYVELGVSDDGVGMDEATQQHLFEPFFTTKALGKGTGLGLSVVYGMVAQSGGHMEVVSALGRGTTFRIRFPEAEAVPAERRPQAVAGPAPARGRGEAVLVVEDSAEVAAMIERTLAGSGYAVRTASRPEDAVEIARREPGLALLLTDLVLPGIDGAELARRVRAERPGLQVLFMSGYARNGVLPEGARFLAKPFLPEELARRVRAAIEAQETAETRARTPPPRAT